MGNCLVTKLKESVQNQELIKIGEVRVTVSGQGGLYVVPIEGELINVRTSDGVAHLTQNGVPFASKDFAYTASAWNNYFDITGENYSIIINNKYKLCNIYLTGNISVNGDDLFYSDNLAELALLGTTNPVNITKVNNKTRKSVTCANVDVAIFKDVPLNGLSVKNSYGSISDINDFMGSTIECGNNNLSGIVNDIISKEGMVKMNLYRDDGLDEGNIGGDLSLASSTVKYIGFTGQRNTCIWSGVRQSGYPAVCLKQVNLGNYVDAMLKGQINCDFSQPLTEWDNVINVIGTHDPSDAAAVAAINTIKTNGWIVIINGETM